MIFDHYFPLHSIFLAYPGNRKISAETKERLSKDRHCFPRLSTNMCTDMAYCSLSLSLIIIRTFCFRSVPDYFIWLEYLSWFKYSNELLAINQWQNIKEIGNVYFRFFLQIVRHFYFSHTDERSNYSIILLKCLYAN